jgi:hypothetical protein
MSGPPPPPQVSPDGKFYWDGERWVPMPQPPQPSRPLISVPRKQPALFYLRGPHLGPLRFRSTPVTGQGCAAFFAVVGVLAVLGLVISGVAALVKGVTPSPTYKAAPRVAFVMTGACPIGQPFCSDGWDKLSPPFTANGNWDLTWSYSCTGSDHYFYTPIRNGDGKTQATGDFTQPNDSDPHGSGVMHAHDNPDAGPRTVDAGASAGCQWTVKVTVLGRPS